MTKITVVVPNWNGMANLGASIESLLAQSVVAQIIVVDNGSHDGSVEFLRVQHPEIELITHQKNLGFAGGVNSGIHQSIESKATYVALFNNDAVADKDWLSHLVSVLDNTPTVGIVTSKLISLDKRSLDSTGDTYTSWGLPYPRGRAEAAGDQYDNDTTVFGASGGASVYRVKMLQEIGLFDKDFFAYYEDVDISFRAQLAGWEVRYAPKAIAYHHIGATSSKIKGFTTYQTMKNLPWLFWKNVPVQYLFRVGWRFNLAYFAFFISAAQRGQGWAALKGLGMSVVLSPKKLVQRWHIQSTKKVTPEYIWSIMVHDLPPNADRLRSLRNKWWKVRGKA